ncbi:Uncharacterised protein [Shigella sonnei]|nr:Uncharacterised protein [Shigella sonnei]CSI35969.1 Uncharacterised protein [Shigella sonnei]CSQ01634.1 Uncharacterised protein [Shigella sonnei]CSQ82867.1 Uncharacterised protein [Shigella sonnei]
MGTDTKKYAGKERANSIAKRSPGARCSIFEMKISRHFFGEAVKQTASRQIPQAKKERSQN